MNEIKKLAKLVKKTPFSIKKSVHSVNLQKLLPYYSLISFLLAHIKQRRTKISLAGFTQYIVFSCMVGYYRVHKEDGMYI